MTAEVLEQTYERIDRLPERLSPQQAPSYRNVMLRTRRAISWIAYAEEEANKGKYHTAFCFYWISFNACYGSDPKSIAQDEYKGYFNEVIQHDKQKTVCRCILYEIRADVEDLVRCRFSYDRFWREGHRKLREEKWRASFQDEIAELERELKKDMDMNVVDVLVILFGRIYCVRNQVMHGCTTRERSTGDDQIRYGSVILDRLIPVFVHLMLHNRHDGAWTRPYYPGEILRRSDDGSYALESGHPWRS